MKGSSISKKEVVHEIAELQQRVEKLQTELQHFQIVADWTYDWEYLVDPNGRIVYMSPSCERITGYRPKEFMDDPELINRIILPEDRQAHEDKIRQMRSLTEAPQETYEEFRILARDGSEHWIDHICRSVFAENGRYLGSRVSNREITDRKQAENALRDSEEKFRSIFEHSLDGILLSDPDGTMFKANPAACRILGMSEAEICEVGVDGLIDHEDPRWTEFLEQRGLQGGLRSELNLKRKDGAKFPASISTSIFKNSEGRDLATSIIRDITERKKMESALKAKTSSLERSNKDLEQFAFVAAHDLREPLIGVAAYLKLLEQRMGKALDKKSRTFLSKAIETTVRMDFLIQSLLAFSRVTANTEELKPTDFNWCLSQALENLRSAIKESGVAVTSDSLPTLLVRESQFIRVFQNLIGNAIKFRAIEPLRIHVGLRVLESEYQFSVCDNGLGIEPPYVDRIFELFQRAHEFSELSGMGIGLASCKTIVERHGGRIWVESEKGKGSTFFFTLPRS